MLRDTMIEILERKIKAYEHGKDNPYCKDCIRKRLAFYKKQLVKFQAETKR